MRSDWYIAEQLDQLLLTIVENARPLPSLAAHDAAQQREQRVRALLRGELPVHFSSPARSRLDSGLYRQLDNARTLSEHCHFGELYRERLDELELELSILDAWGEARAVRRLAARRYGRGDEVVRTAQGDVPLDRFAERVLERVPHPQGAPRSVPPVAEPGRLSVELLVRRAGMGIGLTTQVRVEPRLSSLAAAGERTVFLSPRMFTLLEARRLVAHEVFGHLVVAANARAERLRLLRVGLAGAFADQEGVSLYLEAALGLMCNERLRVLAGRVLATRLLHQGASFGETAQRLYANHGFSAEMAILTAERSYRGGGAARDAGYLAGFLRVQAALSAGTATLDELRFGRVSLRSLTMLRKLAREGILSGPRYRPSLALSRTLTFGGTSPETSPPSDAASLTMLELT